jgi:hypothetical protein
VRSPRWPWSARCGWPGPPRSRPAPRPSTPSRRWWSPHPMGCAGSCGRGQRCGWSGPPPAWSRVRSPPRRPRPGWGWGILARRHQVRSAELAVLDAELDRLTRAAAPKLVARFGVGSDSARALLVAAGDNPQRLRSDAAFSMLCGASPIPASSGKTQRHRLDRGGDRQANAAPDRIVIARLRHDQGLPGPPDPRGQGQEGSHPLLAALRCPGGACRLAPMM